jgi:hypothetical protein
LVQLPILLNKKDQVIQINDPDTLKMDFKSLMPIEAYLPSPKPDSYFKEGMEKSRPQMEFRYFS